VESDKTQVSNVWTWASFGTWRLHSPVAASGAPTARVSTAAPASRVSEVSEVSMASDEEGCISVREKAEAEVELGGPSTPM
jgi:hypothetical protein